MSVEDTSASTTVTEVKLDNGNRKEQRTFFFSRIQRSTASPMLARVAEATYWMSRYVERAEHIARIVLINSLTLMDLGELDPKVQNDQWYHVLKILRLHDVAERFSGRNVGESVSNYLTFDTSNKNSIVSCLRRARENARSIRENISAEMWETINTLYWSLLNDETQTRFEESPQQVLQSVQMGSLLFQGVTDQTLPHAQGWHFIQLAKHLERIDMTCRVLDTKLDYMQSAGLSLETPMRNIQWTAVLRTCCSIEAYRRRYVGDLDPQRLAAFLLLDDESPRTIRFGVREAQSAVAAIAAKLHPMEIDAAERILGRLVAQLEYAELSAVSGDNLKPFLNSIKEAVGDAATAVQKAYFLH